MTRFFEGIATVTPRRIGLLEKRTWQVELVLGDDLPEGSAIYFVYLGMQRLMPTLQRETEGEDGYWRVESPSMSLRAEWFQLSAYEVIKVTLGCPAKTGERATLNIVDIPHRREKDMGLHVHAWQSKAFPVFIRRPGDEQLLRLRQVPTARIDPGPPFHLRCFSPSTIREDRAGTALVKLAYFDHELNPIPISEARLVSVCACGRGTFTVKRVGGLMAARIPACECDEITIEDPKRGLQCRLNPRRVITAGQPHLFWGEIHSHGYVDDGARDADYNYRYARNAACLDFSAQSVHDHFVAMGPGVLSQYSTAMWDRADRTGYNWEKEFRAISDAVLGVPEGQTRWEFVLARAEQYNDPGRFITFPAYEWTASRHKHLERISGVETAHGHRCLYFNFENPPLFCSCDERYSTPSGLFAALEPYRGKVMTIPHHPASHPGHKTGGLTTDWRDCDPDFDRLVEVFSCHGNSEYPGNPRPIPGKCGLEESFVRSAIAGGCKVGIVAGTDNHEARPGQVDGGWGDSPGGMIGVWAQELTRDSIFEALFNRHCYGVSNMARVILEFRLNGAMMGSELELPADTRRELAIHVQGTAPIEDVQIIKNGRPWYSLKGGGYDVDAVYVDHEEPGLVDSYYVTILQEDGEMAWSSPIWVHAR
ncbi:MAG: DUF3604 domain-containing protein [Anaerolineae bacterium]|nr:DUF3604 domain-containing protein [Anaerolineae bacterium]